MGLIREYSREEEDGNQVKGARPSSNEGGDKGSISSRSTNRWYLYYNLLA